MKKINEYKEFKEKYSKMWSDIPKFYALNEKQYNAGIEKLGLNPEKDEDKIYSIGLGFFTTLENVQKLRDITKEKMIMRELYITEDVNGDGFIYDMFVLELNNHEYEYTRDITDAVDALGLTDDDFKNIPALKIGLQKAIEYITRGDE